MVIRGTVTVMESRAWGAAAVLAIFFTWAKTARTDKARGQERSSTSPPPPGMWRRKYQLTWDDSISEHSLAGDYHCAESSLPSNSFPGTDAAPLSQLTPKAVPGTVLREKLADPHSFWSLKYTTGGREGKGMHPTKEKCHKGRWVSFYNPFLFSNKRHSSNRDNIYTCAHLFSPSRHTSYYKNKKKSNSSIIKNLPWLFFHLLSFGDYYCSNYI